MHISSGTVVAKYSMRVVSDSVCPKVSLTSDVVGRMG